jgi:hypothetical protein
MERTALWSKALYSTVDFTVCQHAADSGALLLPVFAGITKQLRTCEKIRFHARNAVSLAAPLRALDPLPDPPALNLRTRPSGSNSADCPSGRSGVPEVGPQPCSESRLGKSSFRSWNCRYMIFSQVLICRTLRVHQSLLKSVRFAFSFIKFRRGKADVQMRKSEGRPGSSPTVRLFR